MVLLLTLRKIYKVDSRVHVIICHCPLQYLLVDALLYSNIVTCDATGCIGPATSRVSIPDSTTVLVSCHCLEVRKTHYFV